MARLVTGALLLTLVLSGAVRADDVYQYLTGVYWFDGEFYQTDITCWNVPGNPEGGSVFKIKMSPGGSGAEAPGGWWAMASDEHVQWGTQDGEYMIPPGEWLSGFKLTSNYDPGEITYHYGIKVNHGFGNFGEFTPRHIPEPWLAGPGALSILGVWYMLRRRP